MSEDTLASALCFCALLIFFSETLAKRAKRTSNQAAATAGILQDYLDSQNPLAIEENRG
jgi:hypothetical protein